MKPWIALAVALAACVAQTGARAQTRVQRIRAPDGVMLQVTEAGDPSAPGILFVHGFAQSSLSFRRQFDSDLAKRFHLVAFDLRGEGASDKPDDAAAYSSPDIWADDIAAVMAATHLRRPVLVGWSFGGYVVADYVRKYGVGSIAGVEMPGSLGGLGPPIAADKRPPLPASMAENRRKSMAEDLGANIEAAESTGAGYATGNMTPEELRTLFATELMMPAYVRRAMAGLKLDNQDVLARLTAPVLFVRGSRDITMPEPVLDALLKALPNARVSRYVDVGHLTFVEQSERFNAELADFAAKSGAR